MVENQREKAAMPSATSPFDRRLQRAILFLIGINIVLLIVNVALYPPIVSNGGLPGLIADIGILLVYGYLMLLSPMAIGKLANPVWRRGVYLGLCSGIVLSVDLVSGYILHDPTTSARTSLMAYGIFLLLIFASGIIGTRQTGKLSSGITTALWCVLIALLIWFCAEFAVYLIFSNTPNGAAFIREEMQADYIRSGATDYQAFALSDFFGAGFFHPLLGLFFALLLGSLGAGARKLWNAIHPTKLVVSHS